VRRLTLILSIAIAACAGGPTPAPAPVVEKTHAAAVPLIDFEVPWASISPEQAGLARAPLESLISECQKTDTDALLIVAGDRVVVARAFGHPPQALDLKSVTKGFTGFAIGFLIAEGKLSLDQPLSTWFPEWKEGKKAKVLLRHVLTHTSGLSHEPMAWKLESQKDRLAYVRALDLVTEPGAAFSYNNEATMLLSGVIAAAAGESIDTYLERRLFEPLGIKDATWSRDGAGNVTTNGGLLLSAVSMAKVGMAVRDGRVVPAPWLAAMQQPAKNTPWVGLLTWTFNDDPRHVQDAQRRALLETNGFTAGAKLAPLDGKRYRSAPAYWLEAGALLTAEERTQLATATRGEVSPIAQTPATPIGFFWDGWLGQYLIVLPKAGVVAIRQRRQPADVGDLKGVEIGVKEFSNLVRLAVEK
jgi:CubicO group peptidase (beta-lactamase class C family)